jgi:hypothetical protein
LAAGVLFAIGVVQVAFGLLLAMVGNHLTLYNLVDEFLIALVVAALSFTGVGALIMARNPANAIGWLFCGVGLADGLFLWSGEYARYAMFTRPGSLPGGAITFLLQTMTWLPVATIATVYVPLLFPDGRLPSPRWRPIAWLAACGPLLFGVRSAIGPYRDSMMSGFENPFALPGAQAFLAVTGPLQLPLLLFGWVVAVSAVVVRFRRSNGARRQQVKWFAFGTSLLVAGYAASVALYLSGLTGRLAFPLHGVLTAAAFACVPVATGIAILRHRLYDIDLLINRTLVYGALTGVLATVYFGGVALLQQAVGLITGRASSQLAIVASTLAIAALFQPLRSRIQGAIDHRFYRRKYDAQRTLAAFGARLRDETDLDRLSADLVATVEETMRPAHVSLWLRPPTRRT